MQWQKEVVAPLVGAWIEILSLSGKFILCIVAPLVGAWIEIMCNFHFQATAEVAPLVGAWIVFLIGQVGLFLMLLINIL